MSLFDPLTFVHLLVDVFLCGLLVIMNNTIDYWLGKSLVPCNRTDFV